MLLSSKNPELRFERNADGTLVAMSPTGKISSNREAKAIAYLLLWVENNNLGEVFSSNCGFKLLNGAIRSPDAAFVARENLPAGWDEGEDEFLNLAPDFIIEIRSKTDNLQVLQEKMQEYIDNGVKLGWLIDRQNKQALVYRVDGSITQYRADTILSGEDIVPGFKLSLRSLF
ncbi:Uma2 family endonuclease [Myxosarcina sp. GI1(2024)]